MRTHILGSSSKNVLTATELNRETFWGLGGDDRFVFFNGDGSSTFADFTDRFIGGAGSDRMVKLYYTYADGGGLDAYQELSFDGGEGYDTLAMNIDVTQGAETESINLAGISTRSLSVEHREYTISVSSEFSGSGKLSFRGGGGDETVYLTQETGSGATMRFNLRGGDDYFTFYGKNGVDTRLVVNSGTGNDVVVIEAGGSETPADLQAVIKTGKGRDTVVLEGMFSETVKTGSGNDTVYVQSGNFANQPDTLSTGAGKDKIYLELDSYSKLVEFTDFSAGRDVIVFDEAEADLRLGRNTEVTFDMSEWEAATEDRLFMNNDTGELYFGDNLLADFGGPTSLTADNFTTGEWDF